MVTLRNRRISTPEPGVSNSGRRRRSQIVPTQSVPTAAHRASDTNGPDAETREKRHNPGDRAPVAEIDENPIWVKRASIWPGATLFKTAAQNKYTLHGSSDLDGLDYVAVKYWHRKRRMELTGYRYNERDVERRAREKHGGPEGFGKILARRFKAFVKGAVKTADVSKTNPFHYPSAYMPEGGIHNIKIPNVGICRLDDEGYLRIVTATQT